ncbi:MAG: hypothetical protein ACO1SV_27010 [Fimbriimonas sp.]
MSLLLAIMLLRSPVADRADFNQAMGLVKEGMSPAQVQKLLGPPEDVWTEKDSGLYVEPRETIWCYGSDGHLSLPTLGRVWFRYGKVDRRNGPNPGVANLPPEAELRTLLRTIHFPPTRRFGYNPLWAIRAANALRPLGKERALAVLVQYSYLQSERQHSLNGPFRLASLLFEGTPPPPRIADGTPPRPKDPAIWPAFPLVIVDGVPFDFFQRGSLRGIEEPFASYAERASPFWTLRKETLRPPDDPFVALETLRSEFQRAYPTYDLRRQTPESYVRQFAHFLNLVQEVYPTDPERSFGTVDEHRARFLRTGARWDARLDRYVRADGNWSTPVEPRYPIASGTVAAKGFRVDFAIERLNAQGGRGQTEVRRFGTPGSVICRFLDAKTRTPLVQPMEANSQSTMLWSWHRPEVREVVLAVTFEGKTYRSQPVRVGNDVTSPPS